MVVSGFMYKRLLHEILVVDLGQRSLTLKLDLRIVRMAESHLAVYVAVQPDCKKKGSHGDATSDVLQFSTSSASSLVVLVGMLPQTHQQYRQCH